MATPAERYAQARRRAEAAGTELGRFASTLSFDLDDFQTRACAALEAGRGVLVAAPTGAGKTVVGEFAVHLALATGRKAFYTTPIKALSNQKYADLARRHGSDRVGLLTGDSSINGEAPVVVMTTEVLRNMMYADSPTLSGLGFVVMDEVHYLADRFRGPVWEEVIIHLPQHVQVASLSATVSNAEEFGAWLGQVRGSTEVVVEEHRPVPLWQHMMVGSDLFDLFVEGPAGRGPDHPGQGDGAAQAGGRGGRDGQRVRPGRGDRGGRDHRGRRDAPRDDATGRRARDRNDAVPGPGSAQVSAHVNPDLVDAIATISRSTDRRGRLEDAGGPRGRRGGGRRGRAVPADARGGRREFVAPTGPGGPGRRSRPPSRAEVLARLDREGLLPAITFIFSRVGCDAAVGQLIASDVRLIPPEAGDAIRDLVEARVAGIGADDLAVLGYWDFVEGLTRGFAAHHAGMLPTFREVVEELFTAGRIRAVFATETLALGINMPARSVVLEKLVKFNGETHADVTPAEYTQLTGRAGRRGIDVEGHAVVLWRPGLDPLAVGGLASTRTYPLRSSFRPTYNMAVNLVAQFGRDRARRILETSFAQFQADRAVVGLTRTLAEHEAALSGYAESMTCHLGDFSQYAALRRRLSDVEKEAGRARATGRRVAVAASLTELAPGDVVWLPGGRHAGRAVVVAAARPGRGVDATPSLVTEDARLRHVGPDDLSAPLRAHARLDVPRQFSPRNVAARRDLAARLRSAIPDEPPRDTGAAEATRPASEDAIAEIKRALRAHPCHACPDRESHARWAERWWRLQRETAGVRRKIDGRTGSVARTFDRICGLLAELGYLDEAGTGVTPLGQGLRRLYSERDLLAAECLRHDVWAGLQPAELAAVVSCLVHEPRREDADPLPPMPTQAVIDAHDDMVRRWSRLDDAEEERSLPRTAYPDPGLALVMYRWASGRSLEGVLRDTELAAGDFVRRCKQTVDLLDQIADAAATPALRSTARKAVDAILRGVVAADRLD